MLLLHGAGKGYAAQDIRSDGLATRRMASQREECSDLIISFSAFFAAQSHASRHEEGYVLLFFLFDSLGVPF